MRPNLEFVGLKFFTLVQIWFSVFECCIDYNVPNTLIVSVISVK